MKSIRHAATMLLAFVMLWTSFGWSGFSAPKVQAASDTSVLFEDDFEDGNYNGWTPLSGSSWTVNSGHLIFTDTGTEAIISAGDAAWSDYSKQRFV
ncbi:hypothetical protein [Marinicrinis lubricantis]|uniref:Uncharacterized protein n=1 Tax=Marinicrinis lubricantis TaxID=2086470 RepID=A0ABW1IQ94_9BACL